MVGGCGAPARARFVAALRVGIPGAVGNNHSLVGQALGRVPPARRPAFDSCEHGLERLGFCALAGCVSSSPQDRIRLFSRLLPGCRACFLPELPRSAFRCPAPAIEMAHWWNACRHSARFLALHRSIGRWCGLTAVDAVLSIELGADPAVFRIRHCPLSLDGRGHHLQAWLGVHGGDCRCRNHLFCSRGPDHLSLPCADDWPGGRHDRHRYSRVFVPAVPRTDSDPARPLFLPRPPRLPPHAHRVRAHAHKRSAY